MHHLPEDQNIGEILHFKILIIMLFHQRDNHFWVVSRSYMALWSDWKQAENDKIILANDLGWEGVSN